MTSPDPRPMTPDPDDEFEASLIRNDMARVICLALASQGYAATDSQKVGLAFLREMEDCGYTLRLMTRAERRRHSEGVR